MLYKEWRTFGSTVIPVTSSYSMIAIIRILIDDGQDQLFLGWMEICIFLVTLIGIGVGAQSIAEEKGEDTLSFLLSRPVSRARIYLTKIGLGLIIVLVPTLVSSTLVFWIDQSSTHPTTLDTSFVMSSLILLLGVMIFCLCALLSIFAKQSYDAAAAGIGSSILLVGGFLLFTMDTHFNRFWQLRLDLPTLWVVGSLLVVLSIGFFQAGLHFFKTKEF